nr:hypothetical protein [Tanacetum cinerariifolium]
ANCAGVMIVGCGEVVGSGEKWLEDREVGFIGDGGKYCAVHSILNVGGDRGRFGNFTHLVPGFRED